MPLVVRARPSHPPLDGAAGVPGAAFSADSCDEEYAHDLHDCRQQNHQENSRYYRRFGGDWQRAAARHGAVPASLGPRFTSRFQHCCGTKTFRALCELVSTRSRSSCFFWPPRVPPPVRAGWHCVKTFSRRRLERLPTPSRTNRSLWQE